MTLDAIPVGTQAYQSARRLYQRGSVSQGVSLDGLLRYEVGTSPIQSVSFLRSGDTVCTCGKADEPCEHVIAALLMSENDGRLRNFRRDGELALGQSMLRALTHALPGAESVRLLAILRLFDDGRVGLGISVGQERLYAVRSIVDMLTSFSIGSNLDISSKFTYRPNAMRFSKGDERLLTMLMSYIPIKADSLKAWEGDEDADAPPRQEAAPAIPSDGRFILLSGSLLQSVMRYLESVTFALHYGQQKLLQHGIQKEDLPLCFAISLTPTELQVSTQGAEHLRLISPDARYVLAEGCVTHLHSAQARVCRLLLNDGLEFLYPAREAEETLGILLPALSAVGTVAPSPELSTRLISAPLKAVVYLDLISGNVEARVEFHYNDIILYPFAPAAEEGEAPAVPVLPSGHMLLRDGKAEAELLDFFSDAGFVVRGRKIMLRRSKDILTFCTQGVRELGKHCEVYASNAFEKVKPRRFMAKASFHMKGGRLVFALLEDGQPTAELLPILKAIAQKQQYVRLKTGEFLDVRDMIALSPVMQEVLDVAALDDPAAAEESHELSFGAYRATYMISMLRMAGAQTETDAEAENALSALEQPRAAACMPQRLQKKLSAYQRRGSDWLLSLYEAHMGGILADEMGLGKTLQVIAALSAAKRRDGVEKSIIVTPVSLTYHWLAELKRFDDSLIVRVIAGPREERRHVIQDLKQAKDVDVILISYPLLRRDIDHLKDIPLRFAVLDEAQSVKNAQSQGALAARELNAQARVALTGTPMENHTGELWSIFNFVLPGYLGTQASFLRRYGGGEHAEELRERIRPFLMRRLKSEVLSDLPAKRERYLYAAMPPEQERVYNTLLVTLRQHVGQALENGSLPRARMQMLSILLKLRQVCCHPKLFLSDYEGASGKLELLVQTVHTAIASGRRMLVFSQFVGMLQIIKKRLTREGVQVLYLDGDTNPKLRQTLCDRFNGGDGKVFLISLKAGGTGLNLTGADLVIHYDPWWNPAAEDQATDRAHRIGQTKDVEVIKLIAQGTIEEKVTDLSKRKRAIFDRVIISGETALSSLSEEDIRSLFFS